VLQESYAPYDIHLTLMGTDRVVDDVIGTGFYLPNGSTNDELFTQYLEYVKHTRNGGYDALNVYFYTDLPNGIQGICPLPTVVEPGSDFFYRDGCQIHAETMPGGSLAPYNLGLTAVHEAGHWFGLLHVFQGGCSAYGDGVLDTPPQATATSGCPSSKDSCPNDPGVDSVHNFMDYSDDLWYVLEYIRVL
jgi:hypothetical protein